MHLSRSTRKQKILLNREVVLEKVDYPLNRKYNYNFWAYDSCNGLFCICPKEEKYFLYNPSTRESKQIPYSKTTFTSEILSGFGYVESIDDYKFGYVLRF
ncbi:hypothetical protein ACOSP7_006371 [Xanthoceras sorbifolium]